MLHFYSATPSLTIQADATSRVAGDKIYGYVQAVKQAPQGDNAVEQADWLNLNNDGTQSAWSGGVSVTIA